MTKTMFTILTAGVLTFGAGAYAADQNTKDAFERKAANVNEVARRADKLPVALHAISVETGVPEDRLREMHKKNPDAGPAGILIASVMADETKQPPEKFLRSHVEGKSWEAIAHDNHVTLKKVNDRLDHLEKAVSNTD